jgi:1-aminocyclopropane-1-carboxylate deaminase/D-cysteine desulfhydrase-like pyridoxal-dependent ACC family enzyme
LNYYILRDFLYIYKAIKVVINSFKSKAFKNKSLILIDIEIIYLNNILNIISIFIKATIKL